jgi:hypothetical protein
MRLACDKTPTDLTDMTRLNVAEHESPDRRVDAIGANQHIVRARSSTSNCTETVSAVCVTAVTVVDRRMDAPAAPSQFQRLTPAHIRALFTAARVDQLADRSSADPGPAGAGLVDAWVEAFHDKVDQIAKHRCRP